MSEEKKTTLHDPVLTEQRAQILNQAFKGLLAIHGGGSVALLAYLQATGNTNPALSKVILAGIFFLVVGLVLALLFMMFRYHTSIEDQRGNPNWRLWRRWNFWFFEAVVAFVVAMLVLIGGAFLNLPGEPPNLSLHMDTRKPPSARQ